MLDRPEPLLPPSLASEAVTVFQFHGYFSGPVAGGLEGHVRQLAGQGGRSRAWDTEGHGGASGRHLLCV